MVDENRGSLAPIFYRQQTLTITYIRIQLFILEIYSTPSSKLQPISETQIVYYT